MSKYSLSINIDIETSLPFNVDTLHVIEDSIQSVSFISQETLNELHKEIQGSLADYKNDEKIENLTINISDVRY